MDYLRKTKDRLMQSVGLAHQIPENTELVQAQQRLKSLYTTVNSMHRSMHRYAESMCMVGEAARTLSDDISKFYSKSPSHQQTVGAFIDASLDQESNALLLFKEQFSDDIDHHFDQWMNEIRYKRDQLKSLFEQHHQIHTLKFKLEDGHKNPQQYQSDSGATGSNGLRHDMNTCQQDEKLFHSTKLSFITEVNNLISTRYERFDVVFMRLMELQKEFFADGLDVTEKFAPILQTYRSKNKITGSATSTATPASPRDPQQQQQHAQTQKPQSQTTSQPTAQTQQPKPSPIFEQPSPQQSQPSPQQSQPSPQPQVQAQAQAQPAKPKEQNLFDLDFGSSSAPVSAASSPQTSTSQVHQSNVFDLFGGNATSTSANPSPKPSTSNNHNTADVLGDFFSPSPATTTQSKPAQSHAGGSLEDFFAGSASTSAQSTPKPKGNASSSDFGFDFLGGSGANNRSSNVDDIDESVHSSTPRTTSSNSNIFSSSKISSPMDFNSFDPLGPAVAPKEPEQQQQQQQPRSDIPQLSENEERTQIQNYKQGLELRIEQWRYRHGQERDIQSLLATLQTVLWTGHTWKKVDTTQLLDHSSVKKSFRRALLTVHPDKVSTGTPEMKATADLVFEILNNSFKRYEIQLGLRSA